jgi:hypothetical protein
MHERICDCHVGGKPVRRSAVTMLIVKNPNLAESSCLESGLQFSVGRVIPPHISGVNEFPTSRPLGIDDAKTIFRCGSERFLAQDGFSGTDRGNADSLNI